LRVDRVVEGCVSGTRQSSAWWCFLLCFPDADPGFEAAGSEAISHLLPRTSYLPSDPVKPHGPLVRLGSTCCHASTCRLSTWWSPTALQGSCDPGGFISGRASHLDAFSGSPVPAWLPGAAFGNTTGTPEASPSRSSRTRDGSPQSSNAHDGYRPNCLTTF
jgi:hypothetical protein